MFRAFTRSAFAVSTVVALSACSSGGTQATPKASITSPHLASPGGSPSPTTRAASEDSATVRINPRYVQVFSAPLPADPAQAAVISGFRESIVLWDQSEVALRLAGATKEYVAGDALANLRGALQTYTKYSLIPIGVDRLFNTKVASFTTKSATVTTCDDGTKWDTASRTTGKALPAAPASQQYAFESFTMSPVDGHWSISSVTIVSFPDQRVKSCMRDSKVTT
jgi:hypothetical protein